MQEAQRVQSIGMSEAQRLQQADIAGKNIYVCTNRERRQTAAIKQKTSSNNKSSSSCCSCIASAASALYSAGMSSFGNIARCLRW